MCQRKGHGPRCYSDSSSSLDTVTKHIEKTRTLLEETATVLTSCPEGSKKHGSVVERKQAFETKLRTLEKKRRSVLRELDSTKTGRKQLNEALANARVGSAEWRELDLRRRNAEAASVQQESLFDFTKTGRKPVIRFSFV
jgi:flagellar biosynthesis/type III secretory pathway chaperone